MAKIKETIPFTFDEIYRSIEKKFAEKGYDAPFEGSNLAQLITSMSYVISNLNFNTATNINENILQLARKRKNVIQDARMLSYEYQYKTSYIYKITLKTKIIGTFTIKKYSEFKLDGLTFTYMGNDIVVNSTKLGQTVSFQVKEGFVIKNEDFPEILTYEYNKDKKYIDIPFDDVENDGLRVTASYYDDFGNYNNEVLFSKNNFSILDKNSNYNFKYFRKDDLNSGNCRIYFKMLGLGTDLPQGTLIKVDVLRTTGLNGKLNNSISGISQPPYLNSFCEPILTGDLGPVLVKAGNDGESNESIKENAPLFYNSASRVVNVHDYQAISNSHQNVSKSMIWGGEDETPIKLGHVYFSFIPEREKDVYNIITEVGNSERIDGPSDDKSISSDRFIYKLKDFENGDIRFCSDEEIYSTEIISNVIQNEGVIDRIKQYSLPALKSNIRHPIYCYVDLYINIKKYPYGSTTYEIRQKLFETLQKEFKNLENFESGYYNSNIIRKLDEVLGINNGIEIYPKFKILIFPDNTNKILERDSMFEKFNTFFKETFKDNQLNLIFYLSSFAKVDDEISVKLNKEISGSDTIKIKVKQSDIDSGHILKVIENPKTVNNFNIKFKSFDGLKELIAKDANLYNFTNKFVYFSSKITNQTANINIKLPRFSKFGDKIEIFGNYSGSKMLLETLILNDEDVYNRFINYLDINRANFAGIVSPENYEVKYTSLVNNQTISGILCTDEHSATLKTDEQDNEFSGLNLNDLFYNYKLIDNKINIKLWIPSFSKPNDKILITSDNKLTEIIITEDIIKNKTFETEILLEDLKVIATSYVSQSGLNIKMFPINLKSKNIIKEIQDDSFNFETKELKNIIPYLPITTYDRITKFVDSDFEFLTHYTNELDIRSLVQNYSDDYNLTIRFETDQLTYDNFKITSKVILKPVKLTLIAVLDDRNGNVQTKNFNIYVKNPNFDVSATEGSGGIYVYLDIPVEGIYEGDKLITNNLPVFEAEISGNEVFQDFTIDEKSIKKIFPYEVALNEMDNLNFKNLEYIKFPILFGDSSDKEKAKIIGTYTIFNYRKPYIRIKLLKEIIKNKDYITFDLTYPTANINFIRNTFLKLRNVYFDTFK